METEDEKKRVSVGLIISNHQMKNNPIFPIEIQTKILDSPFYLLIFIPQEDVTKINCFPSHTDSIKKILIKLSSLSYEPINGIIKVIKDLKLKKYIIHTTGWCYEMENCFYETYISGTAFESEGIEESIKNKISSVGKVIDIKIEDIPRS